MTTNNKPIDKLRDGKIKITIWRKEYEKDGQIRVFYVAEPSCLYEDKNKKLQDGHSFNKQQLIALSKLAEDAYSRIRELEAEDKARAKAQAAVHAEVQTEETDGLSQLAGISGETQGQGGAQ